MGRKSLTFASQVTDFYFVSTGFSMTDDTGDSDF